MGDDGVRSMIVIIAPISAPGWQSTLNILCFCHKILSSHLSLVMTVNGSNCCYLAYILRTMRRRFDGENRQQRRCEAYELTESGCTRDDFIATFGHHILTLHVSLLLPYSFETVDLGPHSSMREGIYFKIAIMVFWEFRKRRLIGFQEWA